MGGTLNHLIVVLPGLGGSALADARGEPIWDGSLARSLARLLRPEPLRLTEEPVQPTGVIRSVSITPFWTAVPGYERLIEQLAGQFTPKPSIDWGDPEAPQPLADIVACPYDFRRSIEDSVGPLQDQVASRLKARRETGLLDRVIVLAHSLGGLLGRRWLAADPETAARCDGLITLGTPHQGSPKALDVLVNGPSHFGLRFEEAAKVLRTWPSMYELLPRYRAVWDETASRAVRVEEIPLPGIGSHALALAGRVHEAIEAHWSTRGPDGLPVSPFLGVGQPTLLGGHWDGRVLSMDRTEPHWMDQNGRLGDGTVPEVAAVPTELYGKGTRLRPAVCRHGWFLGLPQVALEVGMLTDPTEEPLRGVGELPPARLGLEVADLVRAGDLVPVVATLTGEGEEPTLGGEATPWVRWRGFHGGGPWARLACEPREEGWGCTLPPLEEGAYEVELSLPASPEVPAVREVVGAVGVEP